MRTCQGCSNFEKFSLKCNIPIRKKKKFCKSKMKFSVQDEEKSIYHYSRNFSVVDPSQAEQAVNTGLHHSDPKISYSPIILGIFFLSISLSFNKRFGFAKFIQLENRPCLLSHHHLKEFYLLSHPAAKLPANYHYKSWS